MGAFLSIKRSIEARSGTDFGAFNMILMTILIQFILLFGITSPGNAQNISLDKWKWLIGEWVGEGSGQPGQGAGTFTFSFDLNQKVIIRKSHSEYSASGNTPKVIHDDLMIVYPDINGLQDRAIYFDNEGHTILYTAVFQDKSIVLTSEKAPGSPIFRLTYTLLENDIVNTRFEMSPDGINFKAYVEGKSKRVLTDSKDPK